MLVNKSEEIRKVLVNLPKKIQNSLEPERVEKEYSKSPIKKAPKINKGF